MQKTMFKSKLPKLKLFTRGKVRDNYDLGDRLLIVATDRISAFDVVMPNPIPGKGEILTRLSSYWFRQMEGIIGNHMISTDVKTYPEACLPYAEELKGRSMLVKKARPLPVECIVRGYLSGSGWKDYSRDRVVSGISCPKVSRNHRNCRNRSLLPLPRLRTESTTWRSPGKTWRS